jgi:hypothetical protein
MNFVIQNITTEFILHNIVGSDGQYCVSPCVVVLNYESSFNTTLW